MCGPFEAKRVYQVNALYIQQSIKAAQGQTKYIRLHRQQPVLIYYLRLPALAAIRVDIKYQYAEEQTIRRKKNKMPSERLDETKRQEMVQYIVVLIFLARFFLCAWPLPPPANAVLSPDCDGKPVDHFYSIFSRHRLSPSPAGAEAAMGLPTVGPCPSMILASLEPSILN